AFVYARNFPERIPSRFNQRPMEFLAFLPANLGSLYPVACCFLCQISFGLRRPFCWRGSKKLFRVLLDIVQDEAVELGCWFFFELPKRIVKDPLPLRSRN